MLFSVEPNRSVTHHSHPIFLPFSAPFTIFLHCIAIAVMDINTDSNRLHYGMSLNDAFGNVLSRCNRFSLTHNTLLLSLPRRIACFEYDTDAEADAELRLAN